jgi:outer membrane protein TolC
LAAASDVAAAQARDAAARRALALYSTDARTLARQTLDVVRETYQLGRATLFDVLNEQRRYLEFENGYTDALAEAFASRTALQRATGVVR